MHVDACMQQNASLWARRDTREGAGIVADRWDRRQRFKLEEVPFQSVCQLSETLGRRRRRRVSVTLNLRNREISPEIPRGTLEALKVNANKLRIGRRLAMRFGACQKASEGVSSRSSSSRHVAGRQRGCGVKTAKLGSSVCMFIEDTKQLLKETKGSYLKEGLLDLRLLRISQLGSQAS